MGDVLGERHLRSDIEFTIDLVFETAWHEQRCGLRGLDEQRWARTVLSNGTLDDTREALWLLWDADDRRGAVLGAHTEGLRSPLSAAVAIAHRWPELLAERRDELLAGLEAPEGPRRYNSLRLLTADADPDVGTWLPRLIEDPYESVAQLAVSAAAKYQVREAIPALEQAAGDRGRRDHKRILHTLIDLAADQEEILHVAAVADDQPHGLREIAGKLNERLDLDAALALLSRRTYDCELWEWVLDRTLERAAPADWTDDRVARLVQAVVYHDGDPGAARRPALTAIVAAHPEVALEAAGRALYHRPPAYRGLMVFAELDPELLAGDEQAPIRDGLARALAEEAEETTRRHEPIDWDTEARRRLDDPSATADDILTAAIRWRPETLDEHARERLASLVSEAWQTDDELRTLHGARRRSVWDHEVLLGAVNAAATLDLPLSEERWMALIAATAVLETQQTAFSWLRRQYRPQLDDAIVARVAALDHGMEISTVIAAVPKDAHRVLEAVVDRLNAITTDSGGWNNAVGLIGERGMRDALHRLLAGPRTPRQREEVAGDLARLGDPEGQLIVLEHLIARARAGTAGRESPHWRHPIADERVVARLGELLEALLPGEPQSDLATFALGQLGVAHTAEALRVLDGLLARGAETVGSQGLELTRAALARRLATQDILRRLPEPLGEAAVILET